MYGNGKLTCPSPTKRVLSCPVRLVSSSCHRVVPGVLASVAALDIVSVTAEQKHVVLVQLRLWQTRTRHRIPHENSKGREEKSMFGLVGRGSSALYARYGSHWKRRVFSKRVTVLPRRHALLSCLAII